MLKGGLAGQYSICTNDQFRGYESRVWSVVVPDLLGYFSATGSGIEAIENTWDALELWTEAALDAGEDVPKPSSIATFQKRGFKSWVWAIDEIDPAMQ